MKQFEARVAWQRAGQAFLDGRYSRAHDWQFDGGPQVRVSPSPLSVPHARCHIANSLKTAVVVANVVTEVR